MNLTLDTLVCNSENEQNWKEIREIPALGEYLLSCVIPEVRLIVLTFNLLFIIIIRQMEVVVKK